MAERLVIRSYRRVFRVDRRIYRVDRWPVPVPGGVPLRGVLYFAVALALVLVAGALPGLGLLLGEITPPLRYVVLPLGVAVLGLQAAPDGRTAHRFAWDWLCLRLRARRRSADRPVPLVGEPVGWAGVLPAAFDEHATGLHGARVHGPARITFNVGVQVAQRRDSRVIARADDRAQAGAAVVVGPRQVLEVRP